MTLAPFTPCAGCDTPDTCGRAGECRPACPGCKTPHWCAGMGCAKAKASNFATKRDGEPVPGADPTLPPRARILREAERLICGDRQDAYGPPAESFARAAAFATLETGRPFTPRDVVRVLWAVKSARLRHQPDHHDNAVDRVAYDALRFEVSDDFADTLAALAKLGGA